MKLYTEEQMNRAMDLHKANVRKESIFDYFTPIELPSDEEIDKISFKRLTLATQISGFQLGAKWVIEQIKQQDNGN